MKEVFFALAALLVWFAAYVVSAGILTFLSLAAATLLERYFLMRERQTYPIWIIALSLCPLIAFVAGWTLGGGWCCPRSFTRRCVSANWGRAFCSPS